MIAGQGQDRAIQGTEPGLQPQVGTCIARVRQIPRQQQQIRVKRQHAGQNAFQRLIGIPAGNDLTGLGGKMEVRQMGNTQQLHTPGIAAFSGAGIAPRDPAEWDCGLPVAHEARKVQK